MSNIAVLAFVAIQDELKKDVVFLNSENSLVKNILISGDELCGINYDKKDSLILFVNKITKEGTTRVFFEDPELCCQEKYIYQHKNNSKHGFFREFYKNGFLKVETDAYVNGKLEGIVKEYHPNGNLRYIFQFKNDRMNGIQQIFSENYNNLLINEEIYEDEIIKTIFEYNITIEDGILKSYLSKKADFCNGIIHGEYLEYYPNGYIKEKSLYFSGNKL